MADETDDAAAIEETEPEEQPFPYIATWAQFRNTYRGMVLGHPALDAPLCELRSVHDPVRILLGARAKVAVGIGSGSGVGIGLWQVCMEANTYNEAIGGAHRGLAGLIAQADQEAIKQAHRGS